MSPEKRLGDVKQGRAKCGGMAHPARSQLIKSPNSDQERKEIHEMLHINGLHIGKDPSECIRNNQVNITKTGP